MAAAESLNWQAYAMSARRASSEPVLSAELGGIVSDSNAMELVMENVSIVAATDTTVLIHGETGSGKELIARAIYRQSHRRNNNFVKVNCAAIPRDLLESEMFGHEKGAFTGAVAQKIGRFELANGGTLFLDEVGDMPLELQAKLLRVLQEQEFEKLGSIRTQKVDVRVVAATNRDLAQLCAEGKFREDLYYRLNVFPIEIPPLRERPEDIPPLAKHFVEVIAARMHKHVDSIPAEAMEALINYHWPGNVRELRNFIERSVILAKGAVLRPPLNDLKPKRTQPRAVPRQGTLQEIEREHILQVLRASNWVIGGPNGAAVRLGLKRTTLAYRIQKLGISCRPS